jgi:threonine dehydrogenase-like Zn-dependent dehydrogenase
MTYHSLLLRAQKSVRQPERPGAAGSYRLPELSLVERNWPPLAAGQVLLQVHCVSICGTDVHAMQTDADGYSCSSVPATHWESGIQFGHEVAGRVVALGPSVSGFAVGDYVTADSLVPCRRDDCQLCRTSRWNACPRAYLLGFQADGVFGEFAVLPAASIHSIDPLIKRYGLPNAQRIASLAEPLGVALHAYHQASRWQPAEAPQVLVLGGGPIGLFFAWKARASGSPRVVIVEPNPHRANYARMVADLVVHPDQFDAQCNRDVFRFGPDVILDACGHAELNSVLPYLAPGGAIVTMARTGQLTCIATDALITSGQAIIGVRGHVGQVPNAVKMLATSDIDPEIFITRQLDGMAQLRAMLGEPNRLGNELKVSCQIFAGRRPWACG